MRTTPGFRQARQAGKALAAALVTLTLASSCGIVGASEGPTVTVYTSRHYDVEKAFKVFARQTGISVRFRFGDAAALRERIKAEGEETPADVYMTVDAGNLWIAAKEGLLAALGSRTLRTAIPEGLRDPQGRWFALSMRARTIMYNPNSVDPSVFPNTETYAALANPRWQGRLCMRNASNPYQQSLVASLIAYHGYERALQIVKGWVANDVEIINSDPLIIEAVAAGQCDVAIANHYYLGRLLEDNPDLPVKVFWANQGGRGVHVNISGAGVLKNADDPRLGQQLIEWLATKGQSVFVDGNHEYPVNPRVEPEPIIASFGEFEYEPVNAEALGKLKDAAVRLMAQAGYE